MPESPDPKKEEEETLLKALREVMDAEQGREKTLPERTETLRNLLLYLKDLNSKSIEPPETLVAEAARMCENHLIRPRSKNTKFVVPAEWGILFLAYSVLQCLVTGQASVELLRAAISERFVQQLLEGLGSTEQRERDKLKVVLHRIYCRLYVRRPFMRRRISDLLLRHIYEENVPGVREILELYGTIASGLNMPLKEEHTVFLEKVLLPLHKGDGLPHYHQFLTYCVVQFLYKDDKLGRVIFPGLLRYWPKASITNELLFLQEVELLLQVVEPFEFKKIHEKLVLTISKCFLSKCYEVSERALGLLYNQRVVSLLVANPRSVLPILLPSLLTAHRATPPGRLLEVLTSLRAADPELFAAIAATCNSAAGRQSRKSVTWAPQHRLPE